VIGVYKSESLKPVIDADHMPFHQIIRKLGLAAETVAAKIGLPAEQVFKTLVARGDRNGIFACL